MSKTKAKKKIRRAASKPSAKKPVSAAEARKALDEIGRASEAAGTDKLSDEEIEAEIRAYREGR
jgi:hypothetical protein